MFSKLATFALIGVAAAAVYETETDEEVEAWTLSGTNDMNVDITARLIARVEAIENAADPVTTAVQMAQTSMGRLDSIVNEVAKLKRQLATDVSRLANTAQLTGSSNGLDWHKERVISKKWEIPANGRAARLKIITKINQAKKNVASKTDSVVDTMNTRMAAMEAKIDNEMAAVIANAAFTGSDEHIKQVTGFGPDEVDKYWDGVVITSSSDQGEVRGRKFYRVMFNTKQPGFFTSGSDELFMACRALSVHMQRVDGFERDLRPACNHYGHQRFGGLGQCIWIHGSYFSHCGGGGYWRQNYACGGVPEPKLRMTPHYETNQHNWDRHLVHYDRENHHGWVDPYRSSSYQYTLCTGGNQNYKRDFKK